MPQYLFRKSVQKVQVLLKSAQNNGYFTRSLCAFVTVTRSFLLGMRNVSGENCRETQNTHFVFRNFFFENRSVYEIMWKNMVQSDGLKMTTQ